MRIYIFLIFYMFLLSTLFGYPQRFGDADNLYHLQKSYNPLGWGYQYPPMFHIFSKVSHTLSNMFLAVPMQIINFWWGMILSYIFIPMAVKKWIKPKTNIFLPMWYSSEYAYQLSTGLYSQALALPILIKYLYDKKNNNVRYLGIPYLFLFLVTHRASLIFFIVFEVVSHVFIRDKSLS